MKLLDRMRAMFGSGTAEAPDVQLEQACLELLQAYSAALDEHGSAPAPRHGMWVFVKTFDHSAWARDLAQVIVERETRIRMDAVRRATKGVEVTCACRCRAHGRSACPKCTTVEKCPLHHEPDPVTLREP